MSIAPVLQLLESHLLVIAGFAMGALLIVRVLMERRPTGSTLAWLLAIILIPYVGVPLYLAFGGRKLKARAATKQRLYPAPLVPDAGEGSVARTLCALGAPPPTKGNTSELLTDGEKAFAAVMTLIDGAHESIHVSTLILADDEVGRAVTDALAAKARGGVEVRVLIDAFFKFRSSHRQVSALRGAGALIAWFMPIWHVPFRGRTNLRLHRKTIVVDGAVAILGGMNLAREYMGPTPMEGRWRDLSARVTGPAVADIATVFRADWLFASGETLSARLPAEVTNQTGSATIQVVGSGPDVESDLIYDAFLSGVFDARKRLWIATPYFVPDEGLARAVILAVRRGVDVRILVPAHSNHLTADLAGASHLRDIVDAGGSVHCYDPGMMHAKIFVVDDTLGALGSANMDMRSLFLDYEIALFFSSRAEIDGLAAWFASLLQSCSALKSSGRWRSLAEATARLIAPLE